MGKLDRMLAAGGANIAESMGVGVTRGDAPAVATATAPARWQGVAKSKSAVEIPLDKIARDPTQPREEFDPEPLDRLADSLMSRGLLQPIRVRWDEDASKYLIVAGERRWRAARMAGLATLTAIVDDELTDPGERLAAQLVENCLREDLKPIEQAKAYRRLMDLHGWSGIRLAGELALSQGTVSRALSLLNLPEAVRNHVDGGRLAPSLAHEVAKLASPRAQAEVAAKAVAGKLNRQGVREAVHEAAQHEAPKTSKPATRLRREFRLGGDAVVSVAVPAEGGDDAILDALDAARDEFVAEIRKRRSDAAA